MRLITNVAEDIQFMNEHEVVFEDLNKLMTLLDKCRNACLGDMRIVSACKSVGAAMEFENDCYRWLASKIISSDLYSVTEMCNTSQKLDALGVSQS